MVAHVLASVANTTSSSRSRHTGDSSASGVTKVNVSPSNGMAVTISLPQTVSLA